MAGSFDGFKPAQVGLVDMGDIQFYNADTPPPFALSDLTGFKGSFSEIVLNVTWAQLQAAEGGPLTTSAIDSAIAQVVAYNAANGTDLGIKLRVWGGYTAPDWAKNIDGPPIAIDGRGTVNWQIFGPEQIGRIWSADYNDAWNGFQNQLAALYDSNPIIRGISNTAGAPATDEPFVPVNYAAPSGSGSGTVNQIAQLVAGGYNDAAEMLTLRASIADYSQWSTTPLDYTMNCFFLQDEPGNVAFDPNFTLAVLQQARNSSRLVQAGNHALSNPLYANDSFVYAQMGADAALDPTVAPGSYQTNAPGILVLPGDPNTAPGSYLNWPDVVAQGLAADAGNIELWDWPTERTDPGFTLAPAGLIRDLHNILASGIAPLTGAPADGSALDVVAPAFVTGAPGTVAFSGTGAVLLAGAAPLAAYSATLTSLEGGRLGIADLTGTVIGPASGPSLTLSGPIAALNTVLAHLTDTLQGGTLQSGTDVVQIVAADSSGNTAVRNVGVQTSPAAPSPAAATPGRLAADQRFAFGGGTAEVVGQGQAGTLDIAARLGGSGTLVVGGVQSALAVSGDLTVDGNTTLLAALAPGAYSTASLTVGGTFAVRSGAAAYFSGMLGAAVIDNAGAIRGDGTLAVPGGGAILNNGTIEAVSDRTVGAQRLVVGNDLAGAGALVIDAGATLVLGGEVQNQTIDFAANSSSQLSTDPYSPSTLELKDPSHMMGSTIGGFTFADRLVLDNVAAVGMPTYVGGILTVHEAGGSSLSFALSGTLPGDLAGLEPIADVEGSQTTIRFAAPLGGIAPGVVPHAALRGATGVEVLVPDIVFRTPLPEGSIPDDELSFTVTVATNNGGMLRTEELPGGGTGLTVMGSLGQIERKLQSLTYQAEGATDQITVTITDSALRSGQTTIAVDNTPVSGAFAWQPVGGSIDFADPANWTVGGATQDTAPGGANVAQFGPGTLTAAGNGAVGQILDVATTTLTGDVTAQGIGGVALVVDSGGALTLAGGALLAAQAQVTVGGVGQGLLTLMGGALALSGPSTLNALVIGEQAGSNGTVLSLEQIAASGAVVVGGAGSGTLELLGVAASVLDGSADIGQSAGGQGSAIVNGGEWTTSGQLTVGDAGSGGLLINGMDNGTTGQATAFNATIGAQAGSQGSVTLDGGELLVADVAAASSTLAVGEGGTGDLAIENGSETAVGAAQGTIADFNGVLAVGGAAGGRGRIRIGSNGALLVYGNAAVGGAAGSGAGAVIVGESADDTASFALIGTLAIGGTGQVVLGGSNATLRASTLEVAAGGVVSGAGTISGDAGGNNTVTLAGIDNDGLIAAAGGNLLLYGNVTGIGTLAATAGGTLTVQAAVGDHQTLAFSPNARAVLNDARAFAGTIAGFSAGDVLDIAGTDATSAAWSDGVLTLDTAFGAIRLLVAGNYASNGFAVQDDGLGGTNVTGGTGDVHMTTFDGLHYDFQALGDFVAVRSTEPGNPWLIEIRTASAPGATSITRELAAMLGNDRVTFAVGRANPVYVNGAADTALNIGATQNLADGTLTRLSANAYRLTWSAGESVTVAVTGQGAWLDWSVALGPHDGPGSVQGLLGSNSGQATDFQLPNGSVLPQPLGDDQLLGAFADAWRVAPGASLFDDRSVPAGSGTSFSPALLLQYMSAMGDANGGGASHDLNAALQDAASPSADRLFTAPAPSSAVHG